MKSVRVILFSLLLPVVACGGDRDVPAPTASSTLSTKAPPVTLDPPKVESPSAPPAVAPAVEPRPEVAEPVIEIPGTYPEAIAVGKQLAAKGDRSRAQEMFEAAAKLDKRQAEPHIELARLAIAADERAAAVRAAARAVKLAPESSLAFNTLGRAELLRHRYDDAIEAFRQATELNADNVYAWNNLGYTYLLLKQYQDAADALAEATGRKGATAYMWNNLGTAYEQLDQLDDARDAFEQGGELGSVAARASRKRLEGVDTIVVVKATHDDAAPTEKTYETSEPMPEDPEAVTPVPTDDAGPVTPGEVPAIDGADPVDPI